jgi:hypothetical protein
MSRARFAGLALLLAVAQAHADSRTVCENGSCRETVCRKDMGNNEVCDIRTYWDRPSAQAEDELVRALPSVNSLATKLGGGSAPLTSVPHRLYRPRQPAERTAGPALTH